MARRSTLPYRLLLRGEDNRYEELKVPAAERDCVGHRDPSHGLPVIYETGSSQSSLRRDSGEGDASVHRHEASQNQATAVSQLV